MCNDGFRGERGDSQRSLVSLVMRDASFKGCGTWMRGICVVGGVVFQLRPSSVVGFCISGTDTVFKAERIFLLFKQKN